MIVGLSELISLVKESRVEDELYPLSDQPVYMTMRQLGRVALGFAGDGLNAQFINLAGGYGGQHHPVSQAGEKYMPEGIVFVHV